MREKKAEEEIHITIINFFGTKKERCINENYELSIIKYFLHAVYLCSQLQIYAENMKRKVYRSFFLLLFLHEANKFCLFNMRK